MKRILITYSTTDGQTKLICEKIKSVLDDAFIVDLQSIQNIKENFEVLNKRFEHVIVGASIRYGKHSKKLYRFIELNKNILDQKQSIFFSVNVVARKPEKNTPDTNPYIKKFLEISKWSPKVIGVFAGKVDYPNYGFFDKYVIKLIMFLTNGPTDTSMSYEFTNWQKVQEFGQEIDKL